MKTRSALIYTRILLIGVIIMLSFSACSRKKYTVNFDGGFFESKRTQYYAGEKVTVRYDIIATDTDYHFYIDDDVEMTEDTFLPSSCRSMMLRFMRSPITVWSMCQALMKCHQINRPFLLLHWKVTSYGWSKTVRYHYKEV